MKAKKLNPTFGQLDKPETIKDHVQQLKEEAKPFVHGEILQKLLNEIKPVDFEALAFPEKAAMKKEFQEIQTKLYEFLPNGEVKAKDDLSKDQQKELGSRAKDIQDKAEKLVCREHHYLILAIDKLLEIAENNSWGLCKNHDFLYLFNGTFWAELDKDTFQKFLGQAAEKMGITKFKAKFFAFREKLFKQFLSEAYLPTPETDPNKVLINLQNGTFEITPSGTQLRAFKRSDFLTYQLPFEYNKEAKATLFHAYLNRVLPDLSSQQVLAEFLGFVFIKHGSQAIKEEKALILYGTGANGKSVFFEIVNALLGSENIGNFSLQSLTEPSGYYRAKLANKLVNYASEINGKLEASFFKQMVSGEPVEARLPYGQPFTLRQYAKLIFNCNELPKDVEHTNAYFRRFLIIPFEVTIPESEQDKNLHSKIIETELSGVFNWVLEGLGRLLKQKRFTQCQKAEEALQAYKEESNSVQNFLSETNYKADPNAEGILVKDLYPEYRQFCIDNGFKPFNKRNFNSQLKHLGYLIERMNSGLKVRISRENEF